MLKNDLKFYKFLAIFFFATIFGGLCILCYLVQDKIYSSDIKHVENISNLYYDDPNISNPIYIDKLDEEIYGRIDRNKRGESIPSDPEDGGVKGEYYYNPTEDINLFCPDSFPDLMKERLNNE